MQSAKAVMGFVEGFLEDAKPFMDLLKAEGYFTEDMELTDKGRKVLEAYWAKTLKPTGEKNAPSDSDRQG